MIRLVAAFLLVSLSTHAETCRFSGTTSYDGRLAVRANTTQADGILTLDVTIEFTVHAWMTDYRYLGQEISTWTVGEGRSAALRSVAVNQRSLASGNVKRQQWDVFSRNGLWLEGYRIQAKSLDDFQKRYPGFAQHWSPASFGQSWLPDFRRIGAERRPDLDLPATDVQTPLAFAFYWSRFLSPSGSRVSLVLPSFKRDKQVSIGVGSAVAGGGWNRWSTTLRHPALETRPASLAAVWVSPDHRLLQLTFDIQTSWVAGQATLRAEGCEDIQISPR